MFAAASHLAQLTWPVGPLLLWPEHRVVTVCQEWRPRCGCRAAGPINVTCSLARTTQHPLVLPLPSSSFAFSLNSHGRTYIFISASTTRKPRPRVPARRHAGTRPGGEGGGAMATTHIYAKYTGGRAAPLRQGAPVCRAAGPLAALSPHLITICVSNGF